MPPFRGVIFDVDGTLVDSNDAHACAWVDAITEHGYSVEPAHVRRLVGMGGDHLLPAAIDVVRSSTAGQAIAERRERVFQERYLADITAFPQARALVERLRADGYQLIIASSAKTEELEPLLECAQVSDLLSKRVSSDDVEQSKPEPDAIEAALRELDLPPDTVLMIGDTPYDVEAAERAGIGSIALRSGGWGDADLAGALAIYDDLADLLAHYDTSPLGAKV